MKLNSELLVAMLDQAEEDGWRYTLDEQDGRQFVEFETWSEQDEDFLMTIWFADPEDLPKEIHRYGEDFDLDDHVYKNLEAKKNGFAGVPGVVALVDSARWIEQAIENLADSLLHVKLRYETKDTGITKDGLRTYLRLGHSVSDVMELKAGQDCEIFKADKFEPGDKILYIPDVSMNGIDCWSTIYDEDAIEHIISNCYTGDDFIETCGGNRNRAECVFNYCDWQHPSSAYCEMEADGDFEEEEN